MPGAPGQPSPLPPSTTYKEASANWVNTNTNTKAAGGVIVPGRKPASTSSSSSSKPQVTKTSGWVNLKKLGVPPHSSLGKPALLAAPSSVTTTASQPAAFTLGALQAKKSAGATAAAPSQPTQATNPAPAPTPPFIPGPAAGTVVGAPAPDSKHGPDGEQPRLAPCRLWAKGVPAASAASTSGPGNAERVSLPLGSSLPGPDGKRKVATAGPPAAPAPLTGTSSQHGRKERHGGPPSSAAAFFDLPAAPSVSSAGLLAIHQPTNQQPQPRSPPPGQLGRGGA